jgi:predicted ATPase/class 3 adenylate cyclase/Tfp pilus assembly protein PilF
MQAAHGLVQNRYLIVRTVARGGMGMVYEARDQRLGNVVALKECLLSDLRLQEAFEREARVLAGLHHRALPVVSDFFHEGERQFLVMQFIPGDDLAQVLAQRGAPFPPATVLGWADALLDALDYLHTRQPPIIHRDVKPHNLKLTPRGEIMLLDFGLAKRMPAEPVPPSPGNSIFAFTPDYSPLEQMQGTGTDARSDLYALGATLYHLLTARPPPDSLSRAARLQAGEPDPLRPADQVHAGVPAALAALLGGAMALHREQRPASAVVLRDALREAVASTPLAAAHWPLPRPAPADLDRSPPPPAQAGVTERTVRARPGRAGGASIGDAVSRRPVPTGTITFLFTDIEGSTTRWEHQPELMRAALARHDVLLREAIEAHAGYVFNIVGDAFCAAFTSPAQALGAADAAQRALHAETWGEIGPLQVRMALHTGEAEERDGDYSGRPLNRVARILSAGHGGQVLLSQATVSLLRDSLPPDVSLRDLGSHRLRDLVEPEHIYQLVTPTWPADARPLKTLDSRPNNLPVQPTPLVGREADVAAVRALLRRGDVRVVTLSGPGGIGKTRLALQVAADLLDQFPDGVYFVSLAAVSDPALVLPTIAQTLGLGESGSCPLADTLHGYLAERAILLVLDNFEQVGAAAPQLAVLLAACGQPKLLVTSRATLRVRGEHEYPVPPLALPDPRRLPSLDVLGQYAAARLFVGLAIAARPDFELTADNAAAVATICARLDGLPLALELAASRIKLLSPEAMLPRLQSRLGLLTGGATDLPTRQQTLRGAIAWSYDLLRLGEQVLLRRLGIFAGGCTLDAAEAVCEAAGDQELSVLDGIGSLVNQSLVRQSAAGDAEPRFTMLETIREYALERLRQSGEEPTVRRQHGQYFLGLAEQAERGLRGPAQPRWLERLEQESDNLRLALEWAQTDADAATRLRLSGALWRFWWVRGHLSEGRSWLGRALASSEDADGDLRASALNGAGNLALAQGDFGEAARLHEASLALRRALGDEPGTATSLNNLAVVAQEQGIYDRATGLHEQALALRRTLCDQRGIASSLLNLGEMACAQGDYARAAALLDESLALHRDLGDTRRVAYSLLNLAAVHAGQGDPARAGPLYAECLGLLAELGDKRGIATGLEGLASVACKQAAFDRAARLHRAAAALRADIRVPLPPTARADYDACLAAVRERLGETAFRAAWAAGASTPLDDVVAQAREDWQ